MTAMTRKQFVALCAATAIAPPTARSQHSHKKHVPTELWQLDAKQLAQLIQSKHVSSREVVQSCLDRIESCNRRYNAIGEVIAERALKMADAADAAKDRGPLHGVPMTIKSNIDLAGSATSEGLTIWKNRVASLSSPMVRHLLRAGAIPIGRTNLPDLGLRYHTDSSIWGPTINPWDKNLTPGGSSGGDAVAVATGMTPLGFGNDYGGSLRFPAQCCGVAAFKPSLGRVAHALEGLPNSQLPISFQWFSAQGPIARSVDDLAYVLPIISQSDPRDPGWTPARMKASESRPRVAVLDDPGGLGVDPVIAKSVVRAGETLKSLGYQVDVIQGESVIEGLRLWNQIVAADLIAGHLDFIREHASKAANQFVSYLIANVEPPNLNQYANALARRNALSRSWREFNQRYPLVLGPVSTAPPFAVGFDVSSQQNASAMLQSMRLTVTVNLLGLPSVAVPVGLDKTPQVVQIIGPMHGDELCLATAQLLQSATGFKTHPPGWD